MKRWIGDYKSICERPLTADESSKLTKTIRKTLNLAIATWLVCLGGMPACGFMILAPDDYQLEPLWPIVSIVILIMMVALPLKLRDARKLAKAAKKDLKIGIVELFEVPKSGKVFFASSPFDDDDEDDEEVDYRNAAPGSQIEVMKASGTLLSKNGQPVKSGIVLDISMVADPYRSPSKGTFPERFDFNEELNAAEAERQLTDEEREEIENHLETMPRFPFFFAFMTLYMVGGLVAAIVNSSILGIIQAVLLSIIAVSYVVGWIRFSGEFRIARAVKRDLRRGIVLRRDVSKMDDQSIWGKHKVIEVLPRSDLVWSVDGKPASWRQYK